MCLNEICITVSIKPLTCHSEFPRWFQVFQKETVESLQSQLQDVIWLGQGLIQNASKGTSTKALEHDLEDVNTRWDTLNKKVWANYVERYYMKDIVKYLFSWSSKENVLFCCNIWNVVLAMLSGSRTFGPASWSFAALWKVSGCSWVLVQLAERHRGTGGQSEASISRV